MISKTLKKVIDYVINNPEIYNIYFEKKLDFLGVFIYIYHKNDNINKNIENGELHEYLNGIVIHNNSSDFHKLVIFPNESNNKYICATRFKINGVSQIVTNAKSLSNEKLIINNFNYMINENIIKFIEYSNISIKDIKSQKI